MGTAELGNFKFKNRTTSELSYRNLSSNRPSVIVGMLHSSTYFSTFYILKESCLDTKVNWTPPFSAFTFNTRRPLHLHSQAGKPQSGLLAPYGQLKSSISAASVITLRIGSRPPLGHTEPFSGLALELSGGMLAFSLIRNSEDQSLERWSDLLASEPGRRQPAWRAQRDLVGLILRLQ